jgi:CheY-like chemotaxis protein
VLIVDDNVSAAQALATYLSLEGMECRAVFGGHAAVSLATEFKPHVIIVDISMPGFDAYQAALALRGDVRTSAVAIVAFTALDEAELRQHIVDTSSTLITKRDKRRLGLPLCHALRPLRCA